ncbi:MAG: DUF349 domain-containing protein [Candidatus Binatia bacterium]
MGILDKLKPQPRWKHSDPAVRLQAIAELNEPGELAMLAEHDPDAKVRKAAIAKVSEPGVLGRVTAADGDPGVKDAAADRLLGLALDTAFPEAAMAAGLVSDVRRVSSIAKSTAADAVRDVALAKLSDERALGGVARHAKVERTALAAGARLTSADELLATTLNSEHRDVALAAFDRVVTGGAHADVALLKSIEARTQQKAVARRAKTMLQEIEDAEQGRRVAEEEGRKQESVLLAAVESLSDVTDPDRVAADLARLSAEWDALAVADAESALRFAAAADAARTRMTQRRGEIEAARELTRRRDEALASREALCRRVEAIEGDDVLERLAPVEEEWAQLEPLVEYQADGDRMAVRFAQAASVCRKRHAMGTALQEARSTLDALVVEAEALPTAGDKATTVRWRALSREARALMATLNEAAQPASDLADRLAVVAQGFAAQETAAREAAAKTKQERASKLTRLATRGKRTAESEAITLREGDRLLRDITTALDEVGSGEPTKEMSEAIAALRTLQEQLAPRVKELRDMDEWRRFANAHLQEELIAMAEAIVASLKAEEEAGTASDLEATAKAFRELQTRWQEVSDAPLHSGKRLWDRFKAAMDFIRSRCEVYFAQLRQERSANLAAKAAIIEHAEALANSTDWVKTAARLQELQKAWDETGPGPRDSGRNLAQRFRAACNVFFSRRRDDLGTKKKEWDENLTRKDALCARAEQLSESTEWDVAAPELKKLQAEWKTVGPVSHKKSEVMWNRFRSAADKFFERYHKRHELAAAEKVAEHAVHVVGLESLVALEEAPDDLGGQVQALRTAIANAPPVEGAEMKAVRERWTAALAALVGRWPAAFTGTDLDPAATQERLEKLVAKVENLIKEEGATVAPATKSATELLAEKLRSALATNAMGVRPDESKWRAAGTTVDEAQNAWRRIAFLPNDETRALESRFKAACQRVMEQVKQHVRAPVEFPDDGAGGRGRDGRPRREKHAGGRGPGGPRPSRGPGAAAAGDAGRANPKSTPRT